MVHEVTSQREKKCYGEQGNKLNICWHHINYQLLTIYGPQSENQYRFKDTNVSPNLTLLLTIKFLEEIHIQFLKYLNQCWESVSFLLESLLNNFTYFMEEMDICLLAKMNRNLNIIHYWDAVVALLSHIRSPSFKSELLCYPWNFPPEYSPIKML